MDGSGSNDPDEGPEGLSFFWRLVSVAEGSRIANDPIFDADTATPFFTPDVLGSYVLELEVSDGAASDFDNVMIRVGLMLEPIQDLYARAKSGKANLVWSFIPGAAGYNIYRKVAGEDYVLIQEGHVTDYCAYADFGLTDGVTYFYVVTWVDWSGHESSASNEASATPVSGRTRRR